jgi:hypothetical protein
MGEWDSELVMGRGDFIARASEFSAQAEGHLASVLDVLIRPAVGGGIGIEHFPAIKGVGDISRIIEQ